MSLSGFISGCFLISRASLARSSNFRSLRSKCTSFFFFFLCFCFDREHFTNAHMQRTMTIQAMKMRHIMETSKGPFHVSKRPKKSSSLTISGTLIVSVVLMVKVVLIVKVVLVVSVVLVMSFSVTILYLCALIKMGFRFYRMINIELFCR